MCLDDDQCMGEGSNISVMGYFCPQCRILDCQTRDQPVIPYSFALKVLHTIPCCLLAGLHHKLDFLVASQVVDYFDWEQA